MNNQLVNQLVNKKTLEELGNKRKNYIDFSLETRKKKKMSQIQNSRENKGSRKGPIFKEPDSVKLGRMILNLPDEILALIFRNLVSNWKVLCYRLICKNLVCRTQIWTASVYGFRLTKPCPHPSLHPYIQGIKLNNKTEKDEMIYPNVSLVTFGMSRPDILSRFRWAEKYPKALIRPHSIHASVDGWETGHKQLYLYPQK